MNMIEAIDAQVKTGRRTPRQGTAYMTWKSSRKRTLIITELANAHQESNDRPRIGPCAGDRILR